MDKQPRRRKTDFNDQAKTKRSGWKAKLAKAFGSAYRWLSQPVPVYKAETGQGNFVVDQLVKQRSLLPRYLRESLHALKLVTWLRLPQALRLTFAVLAFAVFFAVLVAVMDEILTAIFEEIILNKGQTIKDLF